MREWAYRIDVPSAPAIEVLSFTLRLLYPWEASPSYTLDKRLDGYQPVGTTRRGVEICPYQDS
jgi:hypothetical protein